MHFVRQVTYKSEYKLQLTFENGAVKTVNLEPYLDGEIFDPLKDIDYFKTVQVNPDLDTIVWDNGADLSPDFLYKIGVEEELATNVSPTDSEHLTEGARAGATP
jgi:hypothetical protein